MFVWNFELQTVLLWASLLPLIGAILALGWYSLQRRQHQAADQADLLTPLLAQAPIGFLLFDQAHQLIQNNASARTLLHLPVDAATLPESRWATLLRQDLLKQGHSRTLEIAKPLDHTEAPSRVVRWWITEQKPLILVLLMDVTNEQQAEQSANRLLSDLSHELRTPLATLLTHIQVLTLPDIADEVHQQSLHFMKEETQRLIRMSNQTLELGRLQSSTPSQLTAVQLFPLVESVVTQMQIEAAAKNIQISLEIDEPQPTIAGNPDQLRQVFLNLLDNAVKYSGQSGRVVVTLQNRSATEVCCTIQDNGVGIASEHLPQLGRRFYRAGAAAGIGSGLGLAMVREILYQHNSQLEIMSQTTGDERGTMASFTLLVIDETANQGGGI